MYSPSLNICVTTSIEADVFTVYWLKVLLRKKDISNELRVGTAAAR